MRDVVRHLRRTALDLIDEVEQRDMVVVGAPLLIQPVPEKKDPHPGTMEEMFVLGDAQPPRKKWVDITMARFDKLMPLLSQEQARIVVPEARKAGAEASLGELAALVADMQQHYESLKKLTVGPLYSNVEIGTEALAIYNDTSKLEKPWKELVFILRKKSSLPLACGERRAAAAPCQEPVGNVTIVAAMVVVRCACILTKLQQRPRAYTKAKAMSGCRRSS